MSSWNSINLDNFEYVGKGNYENENPYRIPLEILNSPRSLKACERLLIQPSELVYKNLEEYEEKLSHLPLSEIYRIYEENETERQEKLLKCRRLRKSLLFEEMSRKSNFIESSGQIMSQNNIRIQDGGLSDSEVNYGSDTESNNGESEDKMKHSSQNNVSKNNLDNSATFRNQSHKFQNNKKFKIKSASNVDFSRILRTPRLCPCKIQFNDAEIFEAYMRKYGDLISSSIDLSKDDRKILELLILKNGKKYEWDEKARMLRDSIELDKLAKIKANQIYHQRWQEELYKKRRLENMINQSRYLEIQKNSLDQRLQLLNYLEQRDLRVQNYLNRLQFEKRKQIEEKKRQEALRQLEVGKAIERLIQNDEINRELLAQRLEKKMLETEIRRRRREEDHYRHICELNRIEEAKRELKLEKLESEAKYSVEKLRSQLEAKEERATMNHMAQLRVRNIYLSQGAGNRNLAIEKVRSAHFQLLKGLEEWNRKVKELHEAAQERAKSNYYQGIHRKRARIATDRFFRESRNLELLERRREMEEQKMELVKAQINSKDFRSETLQKEKEKKLHFSRLRAQHGAELREALKEKLDPQTFDKKVARAEIEANLFKKSNSTINDRLLGNKQLEIRGKCYCKCRKKNSSKV